MNECGVILHVTHAASRSEIVVPIIVNGIILGVLDIDSPLAARFDEEDQAGCKRVMETLKRYIDWHALSDTKQKSI